MRRNHFGHLADFLVRRLLLPTVASALLFLITNLVLLALGTGPPRYTPSVVMEIRSDPVLQEMEDPGGTAKRRLIELKSMVQHDVRTRSALLQVISDVDALNQLVPRDPDGNPTLEGLQKQESLITWISKGIQFRVVARNDEVMRVETSFTHTDGHLASKIVNALVDNYIETANVRVDKSLKSTKEFFERQRDLYAQMLAKAEAEMMQFMNNYPGLDPDHPDSFQKMLAARKARLRERERSIHSLRLEREALQKFVNEQPETFSGDAADPSVRNVERIRTLRDIAKLGARISVLESEILDLEERREADELIRRKLPQLNARMMALHRKLGEHRAQYDSWSVRLRHADMHLQAAIDRRGIAFTVLSRPPEILEPYSPGIAFPWPFVGWCSIGVGVLCCVTQLLINATNPRASTDPPAAG